MIIEFIQQKKSSSRSQVCNAIEYIFDVDSKGSPRHDKQREEIEFIGTSPSICAVDPFYPLTKRSQLVQKKDIDLEEIKNAFSGIEDKNKRVKHPFLHIVFSLREGESLTKSQWNALVQDYVLKLGYKNNHWVCCVHKNTSHEHAHLILSCIENFLPHRKTKDSHNYARSAEIRAQLEQKYKLKADNNPIVTGVTGKLINNAHVKPKAQLIRTEIDDILSKQNGFTGAMSLPRFINMLTHKGIGCLVKFKNKLVLGLSFSLGLDAIAAHSLGVGYSWQELQKKGLQYDETLHYENVIYTNEREVGVSNLLNNRNQHIDSLNGVPNTEHYLVVANNDVTKYPLNKERHRYAFFDIKESPTNHCTHKWGSLIDLTKIRKLISNIYDFVKKNTSSAYIELTNGIAGSFLELAFEVDADDSLVAQTLKQPENNKCLSSTHLLLLPKTKQSHSDFGSIQFLFEPTESSNNKTQDSINVDTEKECKEQNHVKVFGDYSIENNRKEATIAGLKQSIPTAQTQVKRYKHENSEFNF